MKIKRMTADAWAVAQDVAKGPSQQGFRPVLKRTAAELRAQGIIREDDVLDPDWQRLLCSLGTAPVVLRVLASHGEATFHTDVVVFPDMALAVTQRRTSVQGDDGGRAITGAEMAVEVVLFRHDEIWPVVRRVIPDLPDFRSAPDACVEEDAIVLSDENRARVAAITKQRHGSQPSIREALDLMRDPDPRVRDLIDADAEVAILGMARRPQGSLVSLRQWTAGRLGLYLSSVDEADGSSSLAEVEPGHLGAEVERGLERLISFARGESVAA